jgi:transcriptional regulator with XRE-family HTH domain
MYLDAMMFSVAQVVGANAREIRLKADVTLDRLALTARFCGLPWTSGRVGSFESGHVAPNLATLYAIALALRTATGQPVTLADLFAGESAVQINDKLTVDRSALRAALSDKPVTGETESMRKLGAVAEKTMRTVIEPSVAATMVNEDFREADRRVCKRLGITLERGAIAMAYLWGKTFAEQRDEQAELDANPQRRGQISRQLTAELQKEINDGND